MFWKVIRGILYGFLFVVAVFIIWYQIDTSHLTNLYLKNNEAAPGTGIKALSEIVKHSWFKRKHYDLQVFTSRERVFFKFYPDPGVLYFGLDITSGYTVGAAMTAEELQRFADTVSNQTDFTTMAGYIDKISKTKPVPRHDYD